VYGCDKVSIMYTEKIRFFDFRSTDGVELARTGMVRDSATELILATEVSITDKRFFRLNLNKIKSWCNTGILCVHKLN
jgi:hypothetical protein